MEDRMNEAERQMRKWKVSKSMDLVVCSTCGD